MKKKKILVISSRYPYPLEKGDKLRLFHQIEVLSNHYDIVLVAITKNDPNEDAITQLENLCSSVYYFKLNLWARLWSLFLGFFQKRPFQVSYFYSRSIKHKIIEIINHEKPDWIYCQLVRAAEYIKEISLIKVIDYMDAFAWGMNKRAETSRGLKSLLYKWESYIMSNYEKKVFNLFDFHTIISEQDRERMNINLSEKIKISPNGVNTQFFSGTKTESRPFQICFIGNMGYLPNVKAVEYIAQNIMPALVQENEKFKFLIAGARPTIAVKKLSSSNIDVRGWVADIRDAYNAADIFIAPIFIGIGQQNKILEAMAMGLPCITSTVVNNSIGAIPGESIIIADNAIEYIDAINYLLQNPKKIEFIKNNARKFVIEKYSWESQSSTLIKLFE